ncbi:hypothetical protein BKI52_35185 [marine bacterium AO1-C]|nr:hypothetical protein BKI52_35185 [marine bacterium AO1-C]
MKKLILFCLTLLSVMVQAQTTEIETFKIDSKILNEERMIKVDLPKLYSQSTKSYPLIVVLDDELIFPTIQAIENQLSATSRMPESIVVSIAKGAKHRSYYAPNLYDNVRKRRYRYGDHQEELLGFFEKELLPLLDKKYRTVKFRTLIGFSPAAIFTLHVLCKKRELFQAYVALAAGNIIGDGYKEGENFTDVISKVFDKGTGKHYLYVVSGSRDLKSQPHIKANVDYFNGKLVKPVLKNLRAKAEIIAGEGHTDVLLPGIISAMDFIFPKEEWIVDYRDFLNQKGNVLSNIQQFYGNLSKKYGFTIYPKMDRLYSMSCFKNIGRALLRQKRNDEAIELFKYWKVLYPNLATPYVYLGHAFKATKMSSEALQAYEKAVEIAKQQANPELNKYENYLTELKKSLEKK